jgi:hypothetical protein
LLRSNVTNTNQPTNPQIGKLEEMWKLKPEAGVDDLDAPGGEQAEVQRVALR